MNYDSETENRFVEFLSEKGYPPDSIVYVPSLAAVGQRGMYRPDFAIIDPERKERLAIIEVKSRLHSQNLTDVVEQLAAYEKAFAEKGIESYLAVLSDDAVHHEAFVIYKLNAECKLETVPAGQFPKFRTMLANKIALKKESLENKIEESGDRFRITCSVLAVAALAIAIADLIASKYDIELLTTERLALLGVSISLVIIPFAAKFKGFGIEYERFYDPKKN